MPGSVQLFCLPYLGGNSTFYRGLKPFLRSEIVLTPIDPKGHGARMGEVPSCRLEDYLADVRAEMQKERRPEMPAALLGYSMGASMAYALYFYLAERNAAPVHLFLLSNKPPYTPDEGTLLSDMNDGDFVSELVRLGGMPPEVAACEELLDLFMPTLRADALLEEKTPWGDARKVGCDMTVIYGKEDFPDPEPVLQWKKCAGRLCSFHEMPGGHFFMADHCAETAEIINRSI